MSAKYPRSAHLPWSPGAMRDDRVMESVATLLGTDIVITEKLDGSNLTLTRDHVFARSHSGPPMHRSFDWAKAAHARLGHQIEPGLSVFGEYCYALHSIEYEALPDYLLVFGVREDDSGHWWEWDMVEQQAAALALPTAPVLFRGVVPSAEELEGITTRLGAAPSSYGPVREGVVARVARAFGDNEFSAVLGKCVRADHVTTTEHWSHQEVRPQRVRTIDASLAS